VDAACRVFGSLDEKYSPISKLIVDVEGKSHPMLLEKLRYLGISDYDVPDAYIFDICKSFVGIQSSVAAERHPGFCCGWTVILAVENVIDATYVLTHPQDAHLFRSQKALNEEAPDFGHAAETNISNRKIKYDRECFAAAENVLSPLVSVMESGSRNRNWES